MGRVEAMSVERVASSKACGVQLTAASLSQILFRLTPPLPWPLITEGHCIIISR